MRSKAIIPIVFAILMINVAMALDYYYTPMNFEPQTPLNHSFTITTNGEINITLPSNFTLVSGSLVGNDSVNFIFSSPFLISQEPEVFTGQIFVNGTLQENYHMLYANDSKIVDLKIEVGHGNGNYIDPNDYIGDDPLLLFNLVRVWAYGTDILDEVATSVRFNCTFPNMLPRTTDRKYTTTYNPTNITALGELTQMEGTSLFRLFVLSQEVDLEVGETYDVSCDTLYYDFEHTQVVADIPDISLIADTTEPLVISKIDGDGAVLYTILNNASYDIRDIQFLFSSGSGTVRYELDELMAGDLIQIALTTDAESGNITTDARFIPQWMFNSRSPEYLYQNNIQAYTTTNPFYNINSSLYYINHTMLTTNILETQDLEFSINILQDPIYGDSYLIQYDFYADGGSGSLVGSQLVQVQGNGSKSIVYQSPDIYISGVEQDFEVIATVHMEDVNGDWWDFPTESLGILTIGKLTRSGYTNNPPVLSTGNTGGVTVLEPTTNLITGNIVQAGTSLGGIFNRFGWLFIGFFVFFVLFIGFLTKKKKTKRKHATREPIYPQYSK